MYWCPVCKKEYVEEIEVCPGCNSKLVNVPEVSKDNAYYDHEAYLITAGDEMEANIVETLLTSNDIPVLRKYREAGAYLNIYMGNTTTGIDIYIPSKFYNIARELIEKGHEADLGEDNIQSEEEKDLLVIEGKKIQRRRSIRAWIILLFFAPGIVIALIYFIIMLLETLFR